MVGGRLRDLCLRPAAHGPEQLVTQLMTKVKEEEESA